MKISGFTFVRNAVDLYYPVVESITSILPICDELVVAAGDSTDGTTALIRGINNPKIKIIETVWDQSQFVRGATNAQQTNIALDACTGDWAFYLQADEVVHEDDLQPVVDRMRAALDDRRVEGLLFDYLHFFGDYEHYQTAHNWYRHEVRIVRTGIGARSWHSAQGFRRDGQKLHVLPSGGRIFHYGWVRPPRHMMRKAHTFKTLHEGYAAADAFYPDLNREYDFGKLCGRVRFNGTHPAVMRARIVAQDWQIRRGTNLQRHDLLRIRLLSFIENRILGMRIGEHRNYILLRG
ncbi:MAG TPA: glycosyltransferase [Candidatus Acidoferrales bacterium]|nr:glycosyltransferase [Candidatus Acidoferrales bacterium]